MEDFAVSTFKNHVVSHVPDFQTKPADSQAIRRVLTFRFKYLPGGQGGHLLGVGDGEGEGRYFTFFLP
jgi:hypothetical protein